jgi:hypothetical protein
MGKVLHGSATTTERAIDEVSINTKRAVRPASSSSRSSRQKYGRAVAVDHRVEEGGIGATSRKELCPATAA